MEERVCKACENPLTLCPECDGDDPYGGDGQQGYYICRNKECVEYEVCCGC